MKIKNKFIITIILFSILLLYYVLNSKPKTAQWLSTEGATIYNESGKPVVLRGVNIAGLDWGEETNKWNSKATKYAISNWHANVIRTRLIQDSYEHDPEKTFDELEKQIINPAKRRGAYVIMHPRFTEESSLPDQSGIDMWRTAAERYKNTPNIIYDIFAEPHDIPREEIRKLAIDVIKAIREVNPRSLILVAGTDWGREINFFLLEPLPYKNIVYRSNPYNQYGEFKSLFGEIANKHPVFIGEFGSNAYPPMSNDDVKKLIKYAAQLNIGWTAWNFHDTGCPCLLENHTSFDQNEFGSIVYSALQDAVVFHKNQENSTLTDFAIKRPIYEDGFSWGFFDESWRTELDLMSREVVASGANSIKLRFLDSSSRFIAPTSWDVHATDYAFLIFKINWGEQEQQPIWIELEDKEGKISKRVALEDYQIQEDSQWKTVKIPMDEFYTSDTLINKIILINGGETGAKPFYLDEIMFSNTEI